MNTLSLPAFPVAKALRHGRIASIFEHRTAASRHTHAVFELINVTVASNDAWLARRALLACPSTAIVRCLPLRGNDRVKLEIRFPTGHRDAVINQVLAKLPHAEIGGVFSCDMVVR